MKMDFFKGKSPPQLYNMEKKYAFTLVITSLIFMFFIITSLNLGLLSSLNTFNSLLFIFGSRSNQTQSMSLFVESKFQSQPLSLEVSKVPKLAYLVSGSKGDLDRLWRTLRALYHPRNLYIVHLDLESHVKERKELERRVVNDTMFAKVGNVHMITKANMVTYRGPTMVANTLHACAILLRKSNDWDWFINLSASDYPLMTQDDILSTFSEVPRNLNFIEHTSHLGWKETQRAKPLIIDPGLYSNKKSDVFWVTQRRDLPTAFKLFTGSAWMMLSREFVEYCVWGYDNLPRTLLMYYTNFVSTPEGYFQTVICNAPEYSKTVVNHDLHYIAWDNPPKQHPHVLSTEDVPNMIGNNAPFARKFNRNDPVLDKIDKELLGRVNGSFVPGGWCGSNQMCEQVVDPVRLMPGPGSKRLGKLIQKIVRSKSFKMNQCR